MTEANARTVLLVKAIEQHDPKAELISRHLRSEASRQAEPEPAPEASASQPPTEEFVARRARIVLDQLLPQEPALHSALAATTWRGWITPTLAAAAFVFGLATNALGPEKRVNILAFPLWGMLCWNLAVYLLLLIGFLKRSPKTQPKPHPIVHLLEQLVLPARRALDHSSQNLWRALQAFSREWLHLSAPLQLARSKCALHLAAALLAAGTIAGMYWRGLAFEYRAGWESTFLNAQQVHQLLQIILGPATLVTGIHLPTPAQLESIRWPGEGENAAPWIHLYAVTAGLCICGPRLILALLNWSRAGRLSRVFPLPLDDIYFLRLKGRSHPLLRDNAWIIPCGLDLQPRQLEALRSFLYEVFGLNANPHFEPSIAYGDEDEFLERARTQIESAPGYRFVLFNMAATPEAECHGRLLQGLKLLVGPTEPHLIALLDESSYRQRLTGTAESESQIEKRRKTWQRLARDHQLPMLTLDLDAPDPDRWYEQLRDALAQHQAQPRPA